MQLKQNSFSLIELLVFVAILSIFFIMAASVVTISLRDMKFNENKIKATHYASQLEEWLRTQKEVDWGGEACGGCVNPTSFTQLATQQGSDTVYCFDTHPIEGWQTLGNCSAYDLDGKYKREVSFSATPVSGYIEQVSASITVAWFELNQERSVTNNTVFNILEQ